MIKVMLSLDLINVVDERDDFYAALASDGWKKVRNVDTVWLKDFPHFTSTEESLARLRNEIAKSIIKPTKELRIKQVFYVAQLGNSEAISRVVEKRTDQYLAYPQTLH